MSLQLGSLDADPAPSSGELMVEQIISSSSPDPVEYRQVQDEWVVVLEGAAVLEIDGVEVSLGPGDWVLLPAATPHRVLMTEAGTRWLAVHVPV